MTIMNLLISALSQGMIYVPMALGVFIAFRVLNMPDLTIEENLAYTRKASRSFFAVNRRDSAYFRDLLTSLNLGLENWMGTRMGLLSGGQRPGGRASDGHHC